RPFGATEKDAQKLHALWLLPMIVVRNTAHEVLCSASKTYLALILLLLAFGCDLLRRSCVRVTGDSAGWCFIALVQKKKLPLTAGASFLRQGDQTDFFCTRLPMR
ncbi:MAG: hypothetical protein KIG29_05375, partial [Oscillospiraceae bacterium]|nr:hypothetical protein [Oscillospiraceae bacterium]